MIEDKDLVEDQDEIFDNHDEENDHEFETHDDDFDSHDNEYESNEPAIEAMLDEIPIEQIISLEDIKHDDFDWSLGPKNSSSYSAEERNMYLKDYENTLVSLSENEIVDGIVKTILDGDVILDLNYKSDGIIPLSDLKEKGELKPGDKVKVYIESLEDEKGRLKLSRKSKTC